MTCSRSHSLGLLGKFVKGGRLWPYPFFFSGCRHEARRGAAGEWKPQGRLAEGTAAVPVAARAPHRAARWPDCFAKWDESFWNPVFCDTQQTAMPMWCTALLPDFLFTVANQSPFCFSWFGFSVPFNRRNLIFGSEVLCLLSRHITFSRVCETRWVTVVPLRERWWYPLHTAGEDHLGFKETSKQAVERGRKS